jgi:hypothetical protein
MFETVIDVPEVTATQSSWLYTDESVRVRFVDDLMSKPSVLWAAGSPSLAALGASPAVLFSVM